MKLTRHRKIQISSFIALIIVIGYILTDNMPEWFTGADRLFRLGHDLSISYFAAYIFYEFTIVSIEKRKKKIQEKSIEAHINIIKKSTKQLISDVIVKYYKLGDNVENELESVNAKLYKSLDNTNAYEFTKEDIIKMCQPLSSHQQTAIRSKSIDYKLNQELTVIETFAITFEEVNERIALIMSNEFVNLDLLLKLQEIHMHIYNSEGHFRSIAFEEEVSLSPYAEFISTFYVLVNDLWKFETFVY